MTWDDLRERFEALVDEARKANRLGELRGLLAADPLPARASGTEPAGGAAPENGAFPGRFGMVGQSAVMTKLFGLIERVAPSDVSVLITGETGTGKELVAKAMHEYSARKDKPFLAENCAAVPAQLLESELFGHTKGSFTGAVADRPGHFTAADGGTVFLDEIGDMPLDMQAKLLRVLEQGEVRPVGSNKTLKVDVRVVAATNKDLGAMASKGTFREDLFYRLNVIHLHLPPLRERGEDVRLLALHLLVGTASEMGLPAVAPEERISPEALGALERWRWPGNVRELDNEVRRCLAMSTGRIELDDLSPTIAQGI